MLPDVPSELIRLAIKDLELVEQDKRYKVNMRVHHRPRENVCEVCLAGAVMAKSLGVDPETAGEKIFRSNDSKLLALDRFRVGLVKEGMFFFFENNFTVDVKLFIAVTPYEEHPTEFKADMLAMADYLEQEGL